MKNKEIKKQEETRGKDQPRTFYHRQVSTVNRHKANETKRNGIDEKVTDLLEQLRVVKRNVRARSPDRSAAIVDDELELQTNKGHNTVK
jgi:hypothetical protein